MVDPKALDCPACNKWHYGPCLDKTIPLSVRMGAGMLVDGDRIPDYRIPVSVNAARSYITEVSEKDAEILRLTAENASLRLDADQFWNHLANAYDIEPRSYFEEKYPAGSEWGDGSPMQMAAHYLWKRNPKVEALRLAVERARKATESLLDAEDMMAMPCRTMEKCFAEARAALADVPAEAISVGKDSLHTAVEAVDAVCKLCGCAAEFKPDEGVWRHKGKPSEDEYFAQTFCNKYGYPIPVNVPSPAEAVETRKEWRMVSAYGEGATLQDEDLARFRFERYYADDPGVWLESRTLTIAATPWTREPR